MEADSKHGGICPYERRTGNKTPSSVETKDTDVHWISREPVKPNCYEFAGRIPWRQGAFANYVEIAHAPKQNDQARKKQWPTKGRSSKPPIIDPG
jgi:hypothetical protein